MFYHILGFIYVFLKFLSLLLVLLDPFRRRWGGPFNTSRNENQKRAQRFSMYRFSQNVMAKIYDIHALYLNCSKTITSPSD